MATNKELIAKMSALRAQLTMAQVSDERAQIALAALREGIGARRATHIELTTLDGSPLLLPAAAIIAEPENPDDGQATTIRTDALVWRVKEDYPTVYGMIKAAGGIIHKNSESAHE